jgi:energy-coupling factor transporter ATP-binding protein EcfA2
MMTQTPLLSIDGLQVEFRTRERTTRAIDGISLDVGAGEFLGLVGESGCGKTVTGLSVLGLLPKTAVITGGSISFDGEDLLRTLARRAVRRRISDLPGSDVVAEPVFTIGSQLGRRRGTSVCRCGGPGEGEGVARIGRVVRHRPHPRRLPPSAVGRSEAAQGDRDGAVMAVAP